MDIKKELTNEEMDILYSAANDFQTKGYSDRKCPRCGGELKFAGNLSSYRISCIKDCGITLTVRGI